MEFEDSSFKALFLDMDGVIWRGDTFIEKNIRPIQNWVKEGREILFLTNNSTESREFYAKKLKNVGIEVNEEKIITSAWATSLWLKEKAIKKVFVIGEVGLVEEIKAQEIEVIDDAEMILEGREETEAVVIGMDRGFTYRKLWAGLKTIDGGGLFIVTNEDPDFPLPEGRAPGAGALSSALQTASGEEPTVVIGKPERPLFEFALKILKVPKEKILVIGDRLKTDILGGKRAGLKTLLVLTGIDSKKDIVKGNLRPDFVAEDLENFFPIHLS